MTAWRVVGGMLTMAVIAAQPVTAQEHGTVPDVRGEWEVSVGDGVGALELVVEGHEISGFMTLGDHGRVPVHSAELDGHELYFEVSFEGTTLVFLGTVDGDAYIGEMSGPHEMPAMEFVAKRRDR